MLMFVPLLLITASTTIGVGRVMAWTETYEVDYFSNVTFHCNFTLHNLTYPGLATPFKKYWVLPDTSILADNFGGDDKFTITATPFDLRIDIRNVDDPDFGVYHCLMIWNNIDYKMDAIRVGLNEQGPYYKWKLEQFERNVIIGCSSAGAAIVLIVIVCIVCRCRGTKRSKDETTTVRNGHVYRVDHAFEKQMYEENPGTAYDDNADNQEFQRSGRETGEVYATVNKAAVRTSNKDRVTVQSAHL